MVNSLYCHLLAECLIIDMLLLVYISVDALAPT